MQVSCSLSLAAKAFCCLSCLPSNLATTSNVFYDGAASLTKTWLAGSLVAPGWHCAPHQALVVAVAVVGWVGGGGWGASKPGY